MKKISEVEEDLKGIPSFPENSIHNRVIKAVLQSIKKPDWATNQAVEDFWKNYRHSLAENPKKEILKEVSTREGIEAIISLHVASIEVSAMRNRLEHAEKKFGMAVDHVMLTLEESEGVDSETSWGVDPCRLWIVKNQREKEEDALTKVVEFVRAVADGSMATPIESIRQGVLPEEIEEVIGQLGKTKMKEFIADIAELMAENGSAGRQAVLKVCEGTEAAKEMMADQEAPKPLRFLAAIVMNYAKK